MKICFGTTLKHLIIPIRLGVFSLLLLSFFLFGGVVKAESSVYLHSSTHIKEGTYTNNGTTFTYSFENTATCDNQLLLVHAYNYYSDVINSVLYDSSLLTNVIPSLSGYNYTLLQGSTEISVWYSTNVSLGVNNLEFVLGAYDFQGATIDIYCNVDSSDPFYFSDDYMTGRYADGFNNHFSINKSMPNTSDLVNGFGAYYLFSDSSVPYYTLDSSVSIGFPNSYVATDVWNINYHLWNNNNLQGQLNQSDYYFSPRGWVENNNNNQIFYILNEALPTTKLEVYSDIVVGENGKQYGLPIPIYYNYCDKYAELENVYLSLCENWEGDICYDESWEYIVLKGSYDLNPCERFMYYKSDVYNYPDYYFNENGIYEFDGIMRLTLDYTTESGLEDEYIDSETFTARIYQPNTNYNPQNYIESGVSSPLILPITATSTEINFIYDLSSYNWNATSSEVCLYNIESSKVADSFCSTLSQDKGTGTITLIGNGTNYEDTFGFVYLEEGIKKLYSQDNFFVQWGEGLAYYEKFEDYNIEALSGLSTHDIACSAEEWEEADKDGVFNFTRLKCRSIKTGLDIADSITSMFRKSIELLKKQVIGNSFPLNIPFKISQSWKLSKNTNLPSELNYLDSGEDGNLKIAIPEEWMGTTSTEIVVWGSEVFNETEETTNTVFNFIRALSKYTIWLLVIIYLLNLAISAFEEFMPRKQTAELEDINIDNRGRISSHYHIFDD